MGTFKKITSATKLKPKMKIREFNKFENKYDNYVIGNKLEDETFEVYPDGIDYLSKDSLLLYYSLLKMISRKCEFWED